MNGANGERVPRFVALDSDAAKGSSHPPMFAAIMRRTKGVKVQYHPSHLHFFSLFITARKRSLDQSNIFRSMCQSFCPGGGGRGKCMAGGCVLQGRGVCVAGMHGGEHAWQGGMHVGEMDTEAGSMHPTGMLSCFLSFCLLTSFLPNILLMIHVNTSVLDCEFIAPACSSVFML